MSTPAPETGQPGTTQPPAGGQPEQQPGGTTPPPEGQQPPTPPEPPKPTETVDFWKTKAREQEGRAKANASAAQELERIKQGQMTEQEKINAAAAQAQRERDEAIAETARWKAAAAHGITEAHFDLLGIGTEDEISDRAKRLGQLLQESAELKALKAQLQQQQQGGQPPEGGPLSGTPQPGSVPGLNPGAPKTADNSYPESWFPKRNRGQAHQQT